MWDLGLIIPNYDMSAPQDRLRRELDVNGTTAGPFRRFVGPNDILSGDGGWVIFLGGVNEIVGWLTEDH